MQRNRLRIPVALVLLTTALALSAPALSQPAPDAAAQADEHFRKGKELLKAGKPREAREEYLTALRLRKTYDVAGNLGALELLLKMPRDAAEHLAYAIRTYASTGTTPEQLAKAKQKLAEAKSEVGAVRVSVSVDGAEVLVDGKSVGRAPLEDELFVDPGARTIEARLAGYEPAQQTIQAAKGSEQAVTLPLKLIPSAPKATPVATSSAPIAPPRAPSWKISPPVLVVGGVLAAGGLAVGIGLTAATNGKATDVRTLGAQVGAADACAGQPAASVAATCAALHKALVDHDTFAKGAVAGFVVGGAFALATAGLALWAAPGAKAEGGAKSGAVRVVPVLGREVGGVAVGGAW